MIVGRNGMRIMRFQGALEINPTQKGLEIESTMILQRVPVRPSALQDTENQ